MLAGMVAIAVASLATDGTNYGDALLGWETTRHSKVHYAAIDLESPAAGHFEWGLAGPRSQRVTVPLTGGLGDRIGTLSLILSGRARQAEAAHIASDLSRHIYSPPVLAEPVPFVAGAFQSRTGQLLVERELGSEPSLVTIAFHVALPGRANQIVASNFGRIGKVADSDDLHVIADSAILQEETNAGRRLAVELPLLDKAGHTIGALSTSFLTGSGGRREAYRAALRVQHDLSRTIPRLENLAH